MDPDKTLELILGNLDVLTEHYMLGRTPPRWNSETPDQVKEETVASILQTDTYEDTQKAYQETMKALALISRQLNAGKKQTMKFAKFSEAEEVVKESIVN